MDNLEKYIVENSTAFDSEVPSLKVWAHIEKHLDTEGGQEAGIEHFVADNRAAFDTEYPNLKIWAAVDKHINRGAERRLRVLHWAKRAAAAVILLAVGATIGIGLNEKRATVVAEKQVEAVAPNFRETEQFYDAKVKAQLTKLANYDQTDPSVLSDLEQIDAVQKELKAELELAPSSAKEEIVKRMIENYQFKLDILERVLRHLETENSEEKGEKQIDFKGENDPMNKIKIGQKHETI